MFEIQHSPPGVLNRDELKNMSLILISFFGKFACSRRTLSVFADIEVLGGRAQDDQYLKTTAPLTSEL